MGSSMVDGRWSDAAGAARSAAPQQAARRIWSCTLSQTIDNTLTPDKQPLSGSIGSVLTDPAAIWPANSQDLQG
jgi:hypothetical protein